MNQFNVVAENPESTVVAEYISPYKRVTAYQSEAELEKTLIEQLQKQAYDYLPIKSERDLIVNLRSQLERLNDFVFSDNEWDFFFRNKIANQNLGIEEKTYIIQEDFIQLLACDDGVGEKYLPDRQDQYPQ